jgi:hypothetical protein
MRDARESTRPTAVGVGACLLPNPAPIQPTRMVERSGADMDRPVSSHPFFDRALTESADFTANKY